MRSQKMNRIVVSLVLCMIFMVFSVSGALAESDKLAVRVMTRNMDAGTDFRYFMNVTTEQEFGNALEATIAEVLSSGIPQRAVLLAAEIAEKKPDLIALQEVTTWEFDGSLLGQESPLVLDQLDFLMEALKAYGQNYRVAVIQQLTTIDVGVASFADHDVILVRTDLPPGHLDVIGTETHLYDRKLPFLPGIELLRGWIAADVKTRGARFKFANTHLESAVETVPETKLLQAAQAVQLVTELGATNLPVILAGDFNSAAVPSPDYPSDATPSYGVVITAGYTDSWYRIHPEDPGFTWPLFWEDPLLPSSGPIERIDLIFSKGPAAVSAEKTGTTPDSEGLYPSDHAGVLTTFTLENSRPEIKKK